MSSLRRPVQRTTTANRSRLIPSVDFVSIQREVSETAKMSRVLRLGGRGMNAKSSITQDSVALEAVNEAVNEKTISQAVSTVVLTPALRLSFAIDHPAC